MRQNEVFCIRNAQVVSSSLTTSSKINPCDCNDHKGFWFFDIEHYANTIPTFAIKNTLLRVKHKPVGVKTDGHLEFIEYFSLPSLASWGSRCLRLYQRQSRYTIVSQAQSDFSYRTFTDLCVVGR